MAEEYSPGDGAAVLGAVEGLVPEPRSGVVPFAPAAGASGAAAAFVGAWDDYRQQTLDRSEELELATRLVAAMMAGVHARLAG